MKCHPTAPSRPNRRKRLTKNVRRRENIMPTPDSEWFFPAFVLFWLAMSGGLSLMGGWYRLAEKFKSDEPIDGERFRFRSGAIGWGALPVSYGSCLFATVGAKG